jgi:hypothetical protein
LYDTPTLCRPNNFNESDDLIQESLLFHGINWNLLLSKGEPSSALAGTEFSQAVLTQKKIAEASSPEKDHDGMSPGHLETARFITNKWNFIAPRLQTIASNKPDILPIIEEQIYTEVNLRQPMFGDEIGHTLDCIGNDQRGNFYVIEIGRGNKSDQLARQLYLARVLYPNVSINGIVAKYKQTDKENMRLFLRLV